jgi:pimeloyl-ACP methyl ester carboxylesterase
MAPGKAGNVYALDLRFESNALVGDLDEVRPTEDFEEELINIRWDTVSTSPNSCSLLNDVAYVELPLGYRKLPRQSGLIIKQSYNGYFWDHVQEGHCSALILLLPEGFTLSRDFAPPIRCDVTGPMRLSAKEWKNRIAILFLTEPDSGSLNLRTTWQMERLTGPRSQEIQRINSLPKSDRSPQHVVVDGTFPGPRSSLARLEGVRTPRYKGRHIYRAIKNHPVGFSIMIFLIVAGYFLYLTHCPRVIVPNSHFVGPGIRPGSKRKLVVFVHGVIGDMDNTWINSETHTSWPEMIAKDHAFADFDVYVYGYQSPCEGSSSNITEIANRFRQQLQDDGFFSSYQELYFVTHSMGGLITKMMLSSLNTPSDSDKLQRVRAVLLVAVPSNGADIASIAAWKSTNPQFRNMDPGTAQAFLQSIEIQWGDAMRSRTAERPFPRSFVAYETREIAGLKIVPALFTSGLSDLAPIAFDYDHIQLVKPDSPDNDVYKWAKTRILESSSYLTSSAYDDVINVTVPDNPTLAKMVKFVSKQRHVAITFATSCQYEHLNARINVNGAQLSGKGVPGFFESAVRPRTSIYFTVNTIQQDVSYEIIC